MLAPFVLTAALAAGADRPTPNADPLAPLAPWVGSCWRGEFPGGKAHDTHCFEPVYGGKFVRDRHVVHGEGPDYRGESVYSWDAKAARIRFWYWSSDGDVEIGAAQPVADGLDFAEHAITEPKPITLRARWRRLDADRYEAVEEQKDASGTWKTMWTIEFQRLTGPAAEAATADAAAR